MFGFSNGKNSLKYIYCFKIKKTFVKIIFFIFKRALNNNVWIWPYG